MRAMRECEVALFSLRGGAPLQKLRVDTSYTKCCLEAAALQSACSQNAVTSVLADFIARTKRKSKGNIICRTSRSYLSIPHRVICLTITGWEKAIDILGLEGRCA